MPSEDYWEAIRILDEIVQLVEQPRETPDRMIVYAKEKCAVCGAQITAFNLHREDCPIGRARNMVAKAVES